MKSSIEDIVSLYRGIEGESGSEHIVQILNMLRNGEYDIYEIRKLLASFAGLDATITDKTDLPVLKLRELKDTIVEELREMKENQDVKTALSSIHQCEEYEKKYLPGIVQLKLNRIKIDGFRGLSNVDISLNGKSVVFFGENGTGKSSVLRCVNLLYANIINNTVNRKDLRQNYNIELEDIQYGKASANIQGDFYLDYCKKESIMYERGMERKSGKRTHAKSNLNKITEVIQEAYLSEEHKDSIPVYVNYGTNRLVWDIPLRIKTHHEFDVYATYEKAIENRIDFRTFFEWYRNQEDMENASKVESNNLGYEDKSLKAVRKAVIAMLTGFSNIHVARKPRLAMVVEKEGMRMNVSQLSDGEKCVLAMFGDLAKRLSLANPGLRDPLQGQGVVLIDEIELHMHPSWQRKVMSILQKTFPNIQFIISTHSPIVLSEIDDSIKVFYMGRGEKGITINDFPRLDGFDINYILETFMETKSRNGRTEALIRSIYRSINDNDAKTALIGIRELKDLTTENNEDVLMAEMLMKKKGLM